MARRFRSKRRRTYRKKRPYYRKRRKFTKNSTSNAMSIVSKSPIGRSFFTKHRYVEVITLDPTTPAFSTGYVYSLNGMYDPNITGTGHQPMGFDTFVGLYDHYRVFATHVKVTFSNRDPTYAMRVALCIRDDNTLDLDMVKSAENGLCKTTVLGAGGSAAATKTLTFKTKTSQFFKRKITQDDEMKGSISANPGEQYFLHICVEPMIPGLETSGVTCEVTLDYFAKWEEPKQLDKS